MMGDNIEKQWLIEFLLDNPIEDRIISRLISATGPPVPSHRLLKLLLLRRVSSEVGKGLISEKILESLELIEEIDPRSGTRVLDSTVKAYNAVVMDCKAIGGICERRLVDMKRGSLYRPLDLMVEVGQDTKKYALESVGLFSKEVTEEMGDPFLRVAAKGGEVFQSLVGNSMENPIWVEEEGSSRVPCDELENNNGICLGNELEKNNENVLGNDFSERDIDSSGENHDAATMKSKPVLTVECREGNRNGEELCRNLEAESEAVNCNVGKVHVTNNASNRNGEELCRNLEAESEAVNSNAGEVHVTNNASIDDEAGEVQQPYFDALDESLEEDHGNLSEDTSSKRGEECFVGNSNATTKNCNPLLTPDVMKVQNALKSSILDLQGVVTDPLPGAIRMAASISANMEKEAANNVQSAETQNAVDLGIEKGAEKVQDKDANIRNRTNVIQPSLMERRSTAHTFEWDGDLDSSSEGQKRRPHLPTPKRTIFTPLRKQVFKNADGRRKVRRWSALEEQTLINAVREHGKGNWKLILDNYHHILEERTVVDLKDKWRNMTK